MENNIDEIVNGMSKDDLKSILVGETETRELVKEGGNMFPDAVPIHSENVPATLKYIYDEILPNLDINRKDVMPLGSTGKKLPGRTSNDIDIGIDAKKYDFLKDCRTVDELATAMLDHCKPVLDDMGIECRKVPNLFSIKCPIQNFDGKQEGEFVQLDMMVTQNMKFQTWSNYAPKEIEGQTYIKGAIRNLILEAAGHGMEDIKVINTGYFKVGKGEYEEGPVEWEEYSFFTAEGLNIKHIKLIPMANQPADAPGIVYKRSQGKDTDSRSLVTNDPDTIAKKMFGPKVKGKDLMTWDGAWDAAHKASWAKNPKRWDAFIEALREKIKVKIIAGMTIPQEMLDELGLDGWEPPPKKDKVDEGKESFGVNSTRESMIKIHQLTGTALRQFLKDFTEGIGDASLQIRTTPKIDGQAYRIAWIDGRTFMETAHSGLMDKEDINSDELIPQAEKDFFNYVDEKQGKKMISFIRKCGLEGVKIIGEALFNGDGLVDDNGTITYVGTTYDAGKIGKNGSLVVFDAKGMKKDQLFKLDEDTRRKVIDFVCGQLSDANVSYYDLGKFAKEIQIDHSDISDDIWEQFRETQPEKMNKQQAEAIRDEINQVMTRIMHEKMPNPDIMPKDDKSIEGVAFELNGKLYGINYAEWKDFKHKYTDEMRTMSDALRNFMAELTGMNPNGKFLPIVNELRSNPDKYQAKYEEMLPEFVKSCQDTIANARTRTDIPKFIDARSKRVADRLEKSIDPALLTNDLNSLIDMVDGKRVDQGGSTIALIPGSFRPPHKGHFDMIKHYAALCDQVIVVISGQSGDDSKRFDKFNRWMPNHVAGDIIQIYCDAAGIDNVRIVPTENPMKWISANLRHFKNCKVMLGLSKKDDTSRFTQFTDEKFTSTLDDVEILPIEDNAVDPSEMAGGENISATYIRDNIDDKEILRKVLPSELDDAQFEKVFNMINPGDEGYEFRTDKSRIKHNMNEADETMDSNQRVAVIITDGHSCIVGKSPQMMRKEFSCCDLMKGHAQMGEALDEAAKREAYEECGLALPNLTRISGELKYSKGTTLTFFKCEMNPLPDASSLECKSFYEYNGREFPEIAQYLVIPLDELPTMLYKGLAKLIVDNDLIAKVKDEDDGIEDDGIEPEVMMEGGHAKSDIPEELKDRINQENVEATMDDIYTRLLPELGLTKDDVKPVGSTGKKLPGGTSGDIDLAMDQNRVIEATGCETPEEFIDYCEDVFAKLDVYSAIAPKYGWKAVSCFWPIANTDGLQEGKYIQLDFVITTNMRFITWGMYSDQEKELKDGETNDDVNPKSAVRQILIKSIAMGGHKEITRTDDATGEEIEMTRYDYTFNEGLFKVTRAKSPKKKGGYTDWKVVGKEFITSDPDEILHIIFDDDTLVADDIMTVRDMWDAFLDSDLYANPETRHEIGRCFEGQMAQHKGRYGYPSWIKFD